MAAVIQNRMGNGGMASESKVYNEVADEKARWLFVIVGVLLAIVIVLSLIRGLPLLEMVSVMLILLMSAVPVALPVMFTASHCWRRWTMRWRCGLRGVSHGEFPVRGSCDGLGEKPDGQVLRDVRASDMALSVAGKVCCKGIFLKRINGGKT
jgi:hypothetical protein